MEVIYASGVLEEVSKSANYYEKEVEGLGKAFLDKVQSAVEAVKGNPLMYRIIQGDYRRHLLTRFPFAAVQLCTMRQRSSSPFFVQTSDELQFAPCKTHAADQAQKESFHALSAPLHRCHSGQAVMNESIHMNTFNMKVLTES